jgi:pimeloyl-ACP methyl ester carboxylesterase
MALLERPDGAKIHYELRGEGPLVALASYWSWSPGVFSELLAELERHHRVLTYDLRGTGESSHRGPYATETDIGDLEALLEEAGGGATLIATADSANRGAKLAARRADLVGALACLGTAPFPRQAFAGREGMIASDTVVEAFLEMLSRDYRGALRTLLAATNAQMSEADLQERVAAQVEYCPQEAALGRVREWLHDDPREEARRIGARLWIVTSPEGIAGPWLPDVEELRRLTRELAPEARRIEFAEGAVSRPAAAAEIIREIARS